jgi:hypothetical protein
MPGATLRAAMSMARLWRDQGKRQQAHDLLAPIQTDTGGQILLDAQDRFFQRCGKV